MRTTTEIKQKIDEYLDKLLAAKTTEQEASYYYIVDALLWVLEDESGAPI